MDWHAGGGSMSLLELPLAGRSNPLGDLFEDVRGTELARTPAG